MQIRNVDVIGRHFGENGWEDHQARLPVGTHAIILPKHGCLLSAYAGSHVVVLKQLALRSSQRPQVRVRFIHPIDPRGSGEDNTLELEEYRLELYSVGLGEPVPGQDYQLTLQEQLANMMPAEDHSF